MQLTSNSRRSFVAATSFILIVVAVGLAHAQEQDKLEPTGGKLSETKPVSKRGEAGSSKASSKRSARGASKSASKGAPANTGKTAQPSSGPIESIAGKWWTSGNDFGTSQVYFEQTGTTVSGVITYADGRSGTLNGVLAGKRLNFSWTNSAGDRGTGSLEQSWNNFLGGTYRNEKGRSGSWTLSRINGNWCFGGSRSRIRQVTHNARGQLWFLSEDSGVEVGHLEGPWIFLHGEFGNVKGTMYYKGNRVDFATGAYWTWCGRRPLRN